MAQSSIEWTDAVWNPVTGCTKVSQGCKNCYAERMARRFAGMNGYPADDPFRVTLHPDKLDLPLRWKKPRRIFVNSMSDLFHKDVPDEFIDRVFAVMALAGRHTFQVLTKRPERMLQYLTGTYDRVDRILAHALNDYPPDSIEADALAQELEQSRTAPWPLPNVWLGVSVENQQAADERIPLLLQTPAAVRFISAEPLLGHIHLRPSAKRHIDMAPWLGGPKRLDWVIVGGESGPGARPMHPDWARSLRDQCKAAGVPFLFKQHGEWVLVGRRGVWDRTGHFPHGDSPDFTFLRVGKRAAGRLLDGVLHDEYPEAR